MKNEKLKTNENQHKPTKSNEETQRKPTKPKLVFLLSEWEQSLNLIRKDPFFYINSTSNLCMDYLYDLEELIIEETTDTDSK